ncbi:MAG: hypothetical protein R3E48_03100 [Burkholderiaceae bacterium]
MGHTVALRSRVLCNRNEPSHLSNAHSATTAFAQLRALGEIERLSFIAEADDYLAQLEPIALVAKAQGGMIHDARIAAICRLQGIEELWSADRDFSRFPGIKIRNPLLD